MDPIYISIIISTLKFSWEYKNFSRRIKLLYSILNPHHRNTTKFPAQKSAPPSPPKYFVVHEKIYFGFPNLLILHGFPLKNVGTFFAGTSKAPTNCYYLPESMSHLQTRNRVYEFEIYKTRHKTAPAYKSDTLEKSI